MVSFLQVQPPKELKDFLCRKTKRHSLLIYFIFCVWKSFSAEAAPSSPHRRLQVQHSCHVSTSQFERQYNKDLKHQSKYVFSIFMIYIQMLPTQFLNHYVIICGVKGLRAVRTLHLKQQQFSPDCPPPSAADRNVPDTVWSISAAHLNKILAPCFNLPLKQFC